MMRFDGGVNVRKMAKAVAAEGKFESSVSDVIDRLVIEIVFVTIGPQLCQAHRRLA